MTEMSQQEYRRRDYRMKCRGCGRWMRHRGGTGYVNRRPAPHASRCIECPIK